ARRRADRLHPHPRRGARPGPGFPRADGQTAPHGADDLGLRAGANRGDAGRFGVGAHRGGRGDRRRRAAHLRHAPARDRPAAGGGVLIARLGGAALVGVTRTMVGARAEWRAAPPVGQCSYFANHTSPLGAGAVWAGLTPRQRAPVRPGAARVCWDQAGLGRWRSGRLRRATLTARQGEQPAADPLAAVRAALDQGDSLILFPEGTRSNERLPQAFKAGLHKLAVEFPHVELVPVYLDTLHRSLPKGALLPLPLPLYCNVNFGAPLARVAAESRADFLERARAAVEAMA